MMLLALMLPNAADVVDHYIGVVFELAVATDVVADVNVCLMGLL